jgi:hypothetical protein
MEGSQRALGLDASGKPQGSLDGARCRLGGRLEGSPPPITVEERAVSRDELRHIFALSEVTQGDPFWRKTSSTDDIPAKSKDPSSHRLARLAVSSVPAFAGRTGEEQDPGAAASEDEEERGQVEPSRTGELDHLGQGRAASVHARKGPESAHLFAPCRCLASSTRGWPPKSATISCSVSHRSHR